MAEGYPWIVELNGAVLIGGDAYLIDGFGFGEGDFGEGEFGLAPAFGFGLGAGYTSDQVKGFLTSVPDGLGLPALRVEDQSYPQRDGIRMFADWYEPRVITLADVSIGPDTCGEGCTPRQKARELLTAWGRHCGEGELVIWTDCHPGDTVEERELTGPFGVVGRPRVAEIKWLSGTKEQIANVLLRFDSINHLLYVLDKDGTPGSGSQCAALDYEYPGNLPIADLNYPLDESSPSAPSVGDNLAFNGSGARRPARDLPYKLPKVPTSLYPKRSRATLTISTASTPQAPQPGFFHGYTVAANRSVAVWVRPVSSPSAFLLLTAAPDSSVANVDGLYNHKIRAGGVDYPFSASTITLLQNNTAKQVVVAMGGTNTRLFINGVLHDTLPAAAGAWLPAGSLGATGGLRFLNPTVNLLVWNDLSIYSSALTTGEVQALWTYSQGLGFSVGNTFEVAGTECVPFKVTFTGALNPNGSLALSQPRITKENGEWIELDYGILASDPPVVVELDTSTGTAIQYGFGEPMDISHLINGNPFMTLDPGLNTLSTSTRSIVDTGTAEICWRPAVSSG